MLILAGQILLIDQLSKISAVLFVASYFLLSAGVQAVYVQCVG